MEFRPLSALVRHELESWQSLADNALEPNPFFEPGFVLPASKALADPGSVHLVRVVDGGETVAAVPAVKHRWRRTLPAISSWRHKYCFLGTPLVQGGRDPADVLRTLFLGLAAEAGHRALVWEQLVDGGPVAEALRSAAHERGWQTALDVRRERAFVARRATETYLDHVPRKRRKELARQRRRLSETVDGELRMRNSTFDSDAVQRFMRVESAGWKGSAGTAFMSDSADASMFREICGNFRERGRLQLLELVGGDSVVAVKCNLLAGMGSFAFKIGFDESVGRFSPGVQLEIDNLEEFHRSGAEWMDSCAASDNHMINRLWPERRTLTSLVLVGHGTVGSATGMALKAAGRLHQRRRGIRS